MSATENRAVFLSYASQDAEAARRICEALRSADVEVWFDQSELRGGDAWDQSIRKQIKDCALFVPVVSANTQARREGYFRLEWKLAAQRTHMIADGTPFLLPIVIDDTRDGEALVPAEFKTVQWTRLPRGDAPEKFCARVGMLLGGSGVDVGPVADRAPGHRPGLQPTRVSFRPWLVPATLAAAAVITLVLWQPWRKSAPTVSSSIAHASAAVPEARQLARKAQALFESANATRDDLVLAEDDLKQAVKADPEDSEIWAISSELNSLFFRGGLDRAPERMEQARMQAERALRLAPRSTEAKFARASYLRGLDGPSIAEAEKILRELTVEAPSDARVWVALGKVVWGALGETPNLAHTDEALAIFARAAAIPSGRAEALGQSGWLKVNVGRYADAESDLDEALRMEPQASLPRALKALLATLRGDLPAAHAAYDQLPEEVRRSDGAVAGVADLWLRERRPDKALAVLAGVTHEYLADPGFTGTTDGLRGYAYQMDGKAAAARSAWEAALKVVEQRLTANPRERYLLLERANLLALLDEREAAVTALRLFEELYPVVGFYRFQSIPVHALLEPPDPVLDLILERCVGLPTGGLRTDYRLEMLRDNARFQALLARATVPPPQVASAASTKPGEESAPAEKSVAVLAFANLSDDKGNEYFSDGISEELINALGKVPGLKVPAGTSSFYFKGKSMPMPEIAKQLGVAYVIEGSVQRAGDKVKISARLSKAADGFQVWSDTFLRDAKDVFAVEDEIAGVIAKNLSLKLGASSAAGAVNPEAFELYLRARQAWNLRSEDGFALAEELLNRSLAFDPNFAPALTALADVWTARGVITRRLGPFGRINDPEFGRIESKITQALALDPNSGEAHASLGFVRELEWKLPEAEAELRRAVALSPNDATAHHWLGDLLFGMGWIDEGMKEQQLALALDPLSAVNLRSWSGSLFTVGRIKEALEFIEKDLSMSPQDLPALGKKAAILNALGRSEEATAVVRRISPDYARAYFAASAGLKSEAEALLPKLTSRFARWFVLAGLGRYGEALDSLDPAEIGFADDALRAPCLDPMRSDPRFAKLIAMLGMTDASARAQAWRAAHPPEIPEAKK